MLVKAVLFALAASLVSATTTISCGPPEPTPIPLSHCTTGHDQCCKKVTPATDPATIPLLKSLGIVVKGVDVVVGITCSPIVGSVCNNQPVCCDKVQFKGLVNIGCTSLSL